MLLTRLSLDEPEFTEALAYQVGLFVAEPLRAPSLVQWGLAIAVSAGGWLAAKARWPGVVVCALLACIVILLGDNPQLIAGNWRRRWRLHHAYRRFVGHQKKSVDMMIDADGMQFNGSLRFGWGYFTAYRELTLTFVVMTINAKLVIIPKKTLAPATIVALRRLLAQHLSML
ncbi:YcxB family protein [Lacticaseibacillus baoqingensis]|uniref:YcxB family protein n=1 Tax=Lacticaseibacillus baoqingensis TaxID=2486013 RepID=A0ABW4E6W0_9LACO|nr:YcxB family protein [Lacticaseibacillus baoqingensis]